MKTYKKWIKSNLDLDIYLSEPCEIDEEIYNYIAECISPYYICNSIIQGGDPQSHIKSYENDNDISTYMTLSNINNKYFYLGILPEFKK